MQKSTFLTVFVV